MKQEPEEGYSLLSEVDFFSEEFDDEEDVPPDTINEEHSEEAAASPIEEPEEPPEENGESDEENTEMPMELEETSQLSEIEQAKREFRAYMDQQPLEKRPKEKQKSHPSPAGLRPDCRRGRTAKKQANCLGADGRRKPAASRKLRLGTEQIPSRSDEFQSKGPANRTSGWRFQKDDRSRSDPGRLKDQAEKSEKGLETRTVQSPLEQERRELRAYMNRLPKAWTDNQKKTAFSMKTGEKPALRTAAVAPDLKEPKATRRGQPAERPRYGEKESLAWGTLTLTAKSEPRIKEIERTRTVQLGGKRSRLVMSMEKGKKGAEHTEEQENRSGNRPPKEERLAMRDTLPERTSHTERLLEKRRADLPLEQRAPEVYRMRMSLMDSPPKSKGKWKL